MTWLTGLSWLLVVVGVWWAARGVAAVIRARVRRRRWRRRHQAPIPAPRDDVDGPTPPDR